MHDLFAIKYSYLIPLLPLIGAAISGFLGAKWLKQQSHWPIWLGVGASALISLSLLFGMLNLKGQDVAKAEPSATTLPATPPAEEPALSHSVKWFSWITVGDEKSQRGAFDVEAGAFFDPLTAVMLCVVTCIGFLITVFAKGYMQGEEGYFRFFAYLGLFIFSMTCLVMGNNFLMLYLGWEGVGLCSYLLIGYYYERPSAAAAAKKAFIVNRIGDFGFALGIMLCFLAFGTISFFGSPGHPGVVELAMSPQGFQVTAMKWVPFLLMLGAFGKSAQFPLYVWLPDAMEGPTPVSALIHAATMVTAGVYMIARLSTLFVANDAALWTIAIVGCFTALFAATIALRQFDLKKVFAYSTISQLGFMFVGVGCLAPVAGVFHLITHAFFKALLFLTSGVVMHAMSGELDMRKMSGLRKSLPWTAILMGIGCLALSGVPPFSGFFSKDEIIGAAFARSRILGGLLLFAAFLTAYYTFRLYFRVFFGPVLIPEPTVGPGHAHDDSAANAHAHASTPAVQMGNEHESGKDVPEHGPAADHVADAAHGSHGHAHNHEPMIMILPLILLAIGAVLAGFLNWPPREHNLGSFLAKSPSFIWGFDRAAQVRMEGNQTAVNPEGFGAERYDNTGKVEAEPAVNSVMVWSTAIAIAGVFLAYLLHLRDRHKADKMAAELRPIARLLEGKYWVDEVYQNLIVEPLRILGRLCFAMDRFVIDGAVFLVSFMPKFLGFTLKITTQRGSLQGYGLSMVLGIAIILLFIFVTK